jgi:hypothetical protein
LVVNINNQGISDGLFNFLPLKRGGFGPRRTSAAPRGY